MSKDPVDNNIHLIADAWLRYHATKDQADWWAVDHVMGLTGQQDTLWRIILVLCAEVDGNDAAIIAHIGAGPLESMISEFGDTAMDLVEPALPDNPTLLAALVCVWGWREPVRPRVDRVLTKYGQEPL